MFKVKQSEFKGELHSTYQPNQYHTDLGSFPKGIQEQILKGDLEYENTGLSPEHSAFLSGEIQIHDKVYEYRIEIWQASNEDLLDGIEPSNISWDDDWYEESFMNLAGEALACIDAPECLEVYLTETDSAPIDMEDLSESEINHAEISTEEYKEHCANNDGYCVLCGEFTRSGCEPDAREYECDECGNKTVFGTEEAFLRGYLKIVR